MDEQKTEPGYRPQRGSFLHKKFEHLKAWKKRLEIRIEANNTPDVISGLEDNLLSSFSLESYMKSLWDELLDIPECYKIKALTDGLIQCQRRTQQLIYIFNKLRQKTSNASFFKQGQYKKAMHHIGELIQIETIFKDAVLKKRNGTGFEKIHTHIQKEISQLKLKLKKNVADECKDEQKNSRQQANEDKTLTIDELVKNNRQSCKKLIDVITEQKKTKLGPIRLAIKLGTRQYNFSTQHKKLLEKQLSFSSTNTNDNNEENKHERTILNYLIDNNEAALCCCKTKLAEIKYQYRSTQLKHLFENTKQLVIKISLILPKKKEGGNKTPNDIAVENTHFLYKKILTFFCTYLKPRNEKKFSVSQDKFDKELLFLSTQLQAHFTWLKILEQAPKDNTQKKDPLAKLMTICNLLSFAIQDSRRIRFENDLSPQCSIEEAYKKNLSDYNLDNNSPTSLSAPHETDDDDDNTSLKKTADSLYTRYSTNKALYSKEQLKRFIDNIEEHRQATIDYYLKQFNSNRKEEKIAQQQQLKTYISEKFNIKKFVPLVSPIAKLLANADLLQHDAQCRLEAIKRQEADSFFDLPIKLQKEGSQANKAHLIFPTLAAVVMAIIIVSSLIGGLPVFLSLLAWSGLFLSLPSVVLIISWVIPKANENRRVTTRILGIALLAGSLTLTYSLIHGASITGGLLLSKTAFSFLGATLTAFGKTLATHLILLLPTIGIGVAVVLTALYIAYLLYQSPVMNAIKQFRCIAENVGKTYTENEYIDKITEIEKDLANNKTHNHYLLKKHLYPLREDIDTAFEKLDNPVTQPELVQLSNGLEKIIEAAHDSTDIPEEDINLLALSPYWQ